MVSQKAEWRKEQEWHRRAVVERIDAVLARVSSLMRARGSHASSSTAYPSRPRPLLLCQACSPERTPVSVAQGPRTPERTRAHIRTRRHGRAHTFTHTHTHTHTHTLTHTDIGTLQAERGAGGGRAARAGTVPLAWRPSARGHVISLGCSTHAVHVSGGDGHCRGAPRRQRVRQDRRQQPPQEPRRERAPTYLSVCLSVSCVCVCVYACAHGPGPALTHVYTHRYIQIDR